ncbi:cytochrome P450 [Tothia fuscella]|uniref:Cytochrome P450 n=1 Tax=Tothia fuscella TaxID=1048955 RepID=A0A9P4U4C0_9PEZI|nr:cytochrome P450 [Tothia fuscella]
MVLDAIIERLSSPFIWIPLLFACVSILNSRITARKTTPKGLPWIGKSSGLFAETRAHISSFNNVRQWLGEGYKKYSQNGKTYIFPDFSGKPEVILPASEMRWLLDQPDSVLSVSELHDDILAGPYAFTDAHILKDPFHEHVIHKSLARRISPLIMDVWDEVGCALDDTWGTDTENWKEVCVFENMMNVIARISNRVFVGLPLCRNETYLKSMGAFAQDVMTTTILIRFVPKLLTPLFGRLFAIQNHLHHRQGAALSLPIIKERLANIRRKASDPGFLWEEPNDYLTWHIRLAQKENKLEELEPERISRRLLPINFAAIHTTVFTITNCLFDLLSPQAVKSTAETPMDVIRMEAQSNYFLAGGTWSKESLAHLTHSDSAVRESMRVSNFLTRGLLRKVVAKDGVENKKGGWRLPYGAYVGVDVHSIQHDDEIYENAAAFDAFRFARAREEEYSSDGSSTGGQTEKKSSLESKKLSLSTTSGTFLPFGHGRHACPGRFLVSHELKMLLTYATMHYEIEQLDTRPPNTWFGQHVIPDMKATIRVRRRKAEDIRL